jgi:plastocyanin
MRALAVALATAALIAGCGGSGPSQPAGSMKVTMTEFKFDPSTMSVPHGKVVFFLVNSGSVQHDMAIRDSSGNRLDLSELVSAGDSVVFTVNNIDAGTYTIYCTQQGHEASGMKGTLTVT